LVANKFKRNFFTVSLNPNYSFITIPAGKSAGSDVSICGKMENTMGRFVKLSTRLLPPERVPGGGR